MTHFLANEWDKTKAQRRGSGCQILSLDASTADERYRLEPVDHTTPERIFERRWAQTVMGVVLDRLAAATEETRFEVLKGFLLEDKGAVSYEAASSQLGMSVAPSHRPFIGCADGFARCCSRKLPTPWTSRRKWNRNSVTCWPR